MGCDNIDGEQFIRIYGEDIKVRAKLYTINGLSAHADRADMLSWVKQIKGLNTIYLIHGELDKLVFKAYLKEMLRVRFILLKS